MMGKGCERVFAISSTRSRPSRQMRSIPPRYQSDRMEVICTRDGFTTSSWKAMKKHEKEEHPGYDFWEEE